MYEREREKVLCIYAIYVSLFIKEKNVYKFVQYGSFVMHLKSRCPPCF